MTSGPLTMNHTKPSFLNQLTLEQGLISKNPITFQIDGAGSIYPGVYLFDSLSGGQLQSPAGANSSTILSFRDITLLAGWGVHYHVRGKFGANANMKRLYVDRAGTGSDWLDTGDMTHNGKLWSLDVIAKSTNGTDKIYTATFIVDGQAPRMFEGNSSLPRSIPFPLKVSGTAAGDVTVRSYESFLFTK